MFPFAVFGQSSPLQCCKISRQVTLDGVTYNANSRIGSGGAATCTISGGAYRETKQWTVVCLLSTIVVTTDWIFIISIAFVALMIILGAYTIVTAAGSPDRVNKGKNYIIFAAIGLVVALFSKGIPDLVAALIGV